MQLRELAQLQQPCPRTCSRVGQLQARQHVCAAAAAAGRAAAGGRRLHAPRQLLQRPQQQGGVVVLCLDELVNGWLWRLACGVDRCGLKWKWCNTEAEHVQRRWNRCAPPMGAAGAWSAAARLSAAVTHVGWRRGPAGGASLPVLLSLLACRHPCDSRRARRQQLCASQRAAATATRMRGFLFSLPQQFFADAQILGAGSGDLPGGAGCQGDAAAASRCGHQHQVHLRTARPPHSHQHTVHHALPRLQQQRAGGGRTAGCSSAQPQQQAGARGLERVWSHLHRLRHWREQPRLWFVRGAAAALQDRLAQVRLCCVAEQKRMHACWLRGNLARMRCCCCCRQPCNRYNVKRRLDKKPPLSEADFERLIEDNDDVSGVLAA